jgi:arylsulfatase A-like enzyme/Tfp pilus assembly protein PilF
MLSSTPPQAGWSSLRVLGVALLAGGGLACGTGESTPGAPAATPSRQPNVVLITLDTTRADRLGSYGYAGAATPNLDRLAAAGIRFERALSPVPLTLPAHASIMTGRYPFSHGVRNNGHFVLPGDVPTLAASFAAKGYDTAAFVSSFVVDRQFGLDRGFAHYDDGLDEAPAGLATSIEAERRGDRTLAAAEAWLGEPTRGQAARPFFLWLHLYDAHEPYRPPSPFREQFAGRLYDGEIAFTDALVGRLLDAVGFGSATSPLVIVAGDHGESLGEHGESTHGLFVYDASLRVPLIVAWPGVLAPRTIAGAVRLIDVAPTVADLTAIGAMDGAEGQSLRAWFDARARTDEPAPAYAETYFPQFFMQWAPLRSLEAGRWKYIDAPEPELYDLQADPRETRNLAASEPARLTSLKRALDGVSAAGGGLQASTPLTGEARERLASLGYLSAATPKEAAPDAVLPDPKRMVALYERLVEGNRALSEGHASQAAGLAREVLAKDRGNAFAELLLGRAALASGQHRQAVDAFKAYLSVVPGSAEAHHWLALAHLRLGDRSRALAEEEAALAIDPRMVPAISLKAGLLLSAGKKDEGIRVLSEAVQRDAANTALRLELADLLTDARRYVEAEAEFRRVIAARPRDSRALLGLGLALGAMSRPTDALDALNRAVDADPRNTEARFARAEVLEGLGRTTDARAEYAHVAETTDRPDLRGIAAAKVRQIK